MGSSLSPPDSCCKRFYVDNALLKSERFVNGPVFWRRSTNSVCIEIFWSRQAVRENCSVSSSHLRQTSSSRSCSSMFLRKSKSRKKTIVEFFLMHLVFKLWTRWFFLIFWSFPMSVAMKSIQCIVNETAIGRNFFQEMPACAVDDVFTPVRKKDSLYCFFWVRLEKFEQLYVVPRPESFSFTSYWTGSRLCFFVDLVEKIVDEGGFRIFWPIHEHERSQFISQQKVACQMFCSQCPPRSVLIARDITRDLRHSKQQGFPDLSWIFSASTLKSVLSWEKRVWEAPCAWLKSLQTMGLSVLSCLTDHEKNVFRSPENGTFFLHLARDLRHGQQWVSPFYHIAFDRVC